MRIIVINLARATERRRKMEEQAGRLGLTLDFLDATDGRALTDPDRALADHEKRRRITPYPLTDNEIGCWISHRRAMQRIVENSAPMGAIVEDDAALFPDFPRVLEAIEKSDLTFDVIDLHRNFRKKEIFVPCHALMPGFALGRVGYTHMNLTAYVMSREGAKKFLSTTPRFAHAVDKEMHRYWANGLDIYGLEKPVAVQDDGGHSYIDETRGQDRPQDRARYPDADKLYWQVQRRLTKVSDTVRKRLYFPGYVRRAKQV